MDRMMVLKGHREYSPEPPKPMVEPQTDEEELARFLNGFEEF